MNIEKIIKQNIDKHGSNSVVLVMSYDDELLFKTRAAIQTVASVNVELCKFSQSYNDEDTEKLIKQIGEARPTLIINAADHNWLKLNIDKIGENIEISNSNELKLIISIMGIVLKSYFLKMRKISMKPLIHELGAFVQKYVKTPVCLILAGFVFLAFEPWVTSQLEKCSLWLTVIKPSQQWLGLSICILSLVSFIIILYRRWLYGFRTSGKDVAIASFIIFLYLYYRLYDDAFLFWPLGCRFVYIDWIFLPYIVYVLCWLPSQKKRKGTGEKRLEDDEPIEDKKADLFNHYNLVLSMLSDLNSVDLSKKSYSVGIAAAWGQGKSSYLALLAQVAEEMGYIVVKFNPRHAASLENIQSEFFESFMDVLSNYHSGVKNAIRKYTIRLRLPESDNYILRLVNMVVSMFSATTIDDINSIISKVRRRVLVVIEDLDRLTAPEIQEVFKLIDRNGSFKNTIFVTAYDKEYVNTVLENYLGSGEGPQPFTDKYFNYEFSLPQQSPEELRGHLQKAIYKLLHTDDEKYDRQLVSSLGDILRDYSKYISSALTSMRHVKRFTNIFCSRYREVQKDVDINDFFLLTLLRYMDCSVYNSLVNNSLLRTGGLTSLRSIKQMYLVKDYRDHLKKKWEHSYDIIELLFPKEDDESQVSADVYGRVRYADSFHLYFYDYKVGDIKLDDIIKLYSAEDFKDISSTLDDYLKTSREPFCDFLISRKAGWFENSTVFEMNAKMLLYVNDKYDINQRWNLDRVVSAKNCDAAVKQHLYTDNDAYKEAMRKVIEEMVIYRPWQLGYSIISLMESILKGENVDYECIFSCAELAVFALQCQKTYYNTYGNDDWNYTIAVHLANIPASVNPLKYEEEAAFELHKLLTRNIDDVLKSLVNHSTQRELDGKITFITIKLLNGYSPQLYYPTNGLQFSDFTKAITDKDQAFVVNRLYEAKPKVGFITVECPNKEIKQGDFKMYREMIEASDRKRDEESIVKACSNFICDYSQLAKLSKLTIERVKELVPSLVKASRIKGRIGLLRDKMEGYQIGDYVKVKDTGQLISTNKMFGPDALFKIESISNGKAKIEYHDQSFDLKDLLPVPIDGYADKKLYWDPLVAASIVRPGDPIPVDNRNYDYYMDTLKRDFDNLYDKIKKAGCQYVHEVQHLMKENGFNANELKIRR